MIETRTGPEQTLARQERTPHLDLPFQKGLFLVWGAPQGSHRSQFFAQRLNIPVKHVSLTEKQGKFSALFKYPYQALLTVFLLFRKQPEVIFVQDPPILAGLPVLLYTKLSRASFVLDAHTDALLASWWTWTLPLHRFLSRRAIATLVTNDHLAEIVRSWGAQAFVLTDPPITSPPTRDIFIDPSVFSVMVVSSVSYDEPIAEILEAAKNLPVYEFYITGKYPQLRPDLVREAPPNVQFTGYIPDQDFYGLMKASHVVLGLTTEDHTLQSSANEALWMGKPIITSDWPLLRKCFPIGALHIDNSARGIREALQHMAQNLSRYKAEIQELQDKRRQEWDAKLSQLLEIISNHRRKP